MPWLERFAKDLNATASRLRSFTTLTVRRGEAARSVPCLKVLPRLPSLQCKVFSAPWSRRARVHRAAAAKLNCPQAGTHVDCPQPGARRKLGLSRGG
jgi:hypothetical protein